MDMTEHLPECWATYPSDPPAWCICDELRACEVRIIAGAYHEGRADFKDLAISAIIAIKESDD